MCSTVSSPTSLSPWSPGLLVTPRAENSQEQVVSILTTPIQHGNATVQPGGVPALRETRREGEEQRSAVSHILTLCIVKALVVAGNKHVLCTCAGGIVHLSSSRYSLSPSSHQDPKSPLW